MVLPLANVPPKAAEGSVKKGLLKFGLAGTKFVPMVPIPMAPTVSPVAVNVVLDVNVSVHSCSIEPTPCGTIGWLTLSNVPRAEVSAMSVTVACVSTGVYTLDTYVGETVWKLYASGVVVKVSVATLPL